MTKTFPTLYGVSSKGVTKVWKISVTGATILVEHGQLDGKIQQAPETIREGKNIGRANETSASQQALLEAESKWKKQHDKNYTENLPKIDGGMGKITLKHLPMLAQKFKERKQHIRWPAFVQPKLDGIRCLVLRERGKIIFLSRKAKVLKNFVYMEQEFLGFMKDGDILDGEMYNHGDVTFQELMSLIKDEKTPDLARLKKFVKFHCYDHPQGDRGFAARYVIWRYEVPNGLNYIRLVDTFSVKNEADVAKYHGQFMEAGYEGSIIRSGGDEPYKFQYRDNQLQKNKDFIDDEFEIVGCDQGTGKAEGQAIFVCKIRSGKEFSVRCKGTDAVRQEQWVNRKKYMGKELTVRYQNLSDESIPRFPVGIIVRDYE